MIWEVLLLVLAIGSVVIYWRNKKFILSLPYLLMIFMTPIYAILDRTIFVKILGCGCVPSAQTNMFNIAFNANDLRVVIYAVLTICMVILGAFFTKKLESKKEKIIYLITILAFNSFLAFQICKLMMWG